MACCKNVQPAEVCGIYNILVLFIHTRKKCSKYKKLKIKYPCQRRTLAQLTHCAVEMVSWCEYIYNNDKIYCKTTINHRIYTLILPILFILLGLMNRNILELSVYRYKLITYNSRYARVL